MLDNRKSRNSSSRGVSYLKSKRDLSKSCDDNYRSHSSKNISRKHSSGRSYLKERSRSKEKQHGSKSFNSYSKEEKIINLQKSSNKRECYHKSSDDLKSDFVFKEFEIKGSLNWYSEIKLNSPSECYSKNIHINNNVDLIKPENINAQSLKWENEISNSKNVKSVRRNKYVKKTLSISPVLCDNKKAVQSSGVNGLKNYIADFIKKKIEDNKCIEIRKESGVNNVKEDIIIRQDISPLEVSVRNCTTYDDNGILKTFDVFDYNHRKVNIDKIQLVDPKLPNVSVGNKFDKKVEVVNNVGQTKESNDLMEFENNFELANLIAEMPIVFSEWTLIPLDVPMRKFLSRDSIDISSCHKHDPRIEHLRH